ncbi:hypothetical protein [Anaeroselena agilis]|uniref:Uncharacterized protein n=1 Tax=Anaeroselena agilis TaxID=3063788 RepID=A0ABU3NVV6_9FIRM|nr:hypothetical protein [Selenomonadales bacterium 4137-cl]
MNNFLPERIYKRLKDSPAYQAIDAKVNSVKYARLDIAWFVIEDDVVKGMLAAELNDLERQIAHMDGDMALMFHAMHTHNADELKRLLSTAKDKELRLMIYQELYSFMEDDFEVWMKKFLDEFDFDPNLSAKMFLEWFQFYMYFYRKNLKWDTAMAADFFLAVEKAKAKVSPFVSPDILNHMTVRQYAEFTGDIVRLAPSPDKALEQIRSVELRLPYFQYEAVSYHIMDLMDRLFDIYFWARDFESCFRVALNLNTYMNYGLANKEQLLRGINFYDFNYALPLLMLIYKWRKIYEVVPNLGLGFENLTVMEKKATKDDVSTIDLLKEKYGVQVFREDVHRANEEKMRRQVKTIVQGNIEALRAFNLYLGVTK